MHRHGHSCQPPASSVRYSLRKREEGSSSSRQPPVPASSVVVTATFVLKVPREHWGGDREALSDAASSSSWNRAMKRLVGIKGSFPATGTARTAWDTEMNKLDFHHAHILWRLPKGHLDRPRNKVHPCGKRCYQLRAVPFKLFLPQVFFTVPSGPEKLTGTCMGLSPTQPCSSKALGGPCWFYLRTNLAAHFFCSSQQLSSLMSRSPPLSSKYISGLIFNCTF